MYAALSGGEEAGMRRQQQTRPYSAAAKARILELLEESTREYEQTKIRLDDKKAAFKLAEIAFEKAVETFKGQL